MKRPNHSKLWVLFKMYPEVTLLTLGSSDKQVSILGKFEGTKRNVYVCVRLILENRYINIHKEQSAALERTVSVTRELQSIVGSLICPN